MSEENALLQDEISDSVTADIKSPSVVIDGMKSEQNWNKSTAIIGDTNYYSENLLNNILESKISYVSENERVITRQRQKEGIETAKKKGVQFGRPAKKYPDNWDELVVQFENGEISANEAADACGITASTFYRRLKKLKRTT